MNTTVSTSTSAVLVALAAACAAPLPEPLPAPEDLPRRTAPPDPLVTLDGRSVETPAMWWGERRPEVARLVQHYVYGYLPPPLPVSFAGAVRVEGALGGLGTFEELDLRLSLPDGGSYPVRVALFLPLPGPRPAPVFLALNKCGNHTVSEVEAATVVQRPWLHGACIEDYEAHGTRAEHWPVEDLLARGWALATVACADFDPDKHDWSDGLHAAYPQPGTPPDERWGTLAAWAFGLSRVVDHLETRPDLDPGRICLTGWSRRGKAALLCAALDERVALVVPHQSGTGGMALSRMDPEESVERINSVLPHWFNDNFPRFGADPELLPVDQHLLVALCAPRPLLDDAGLRDTWASPDLALESLRLASPVYELLGVPGVLGSGLVHDGIGEGEVGRLLQHRRDTEHELDAEWWRGMLDFAERHLGAP